MNLEILIQEIKTKKLNKKMDLEILENSRKSSKISQKKKMNGYNFNKMMKYGILRNRQKKTIVLKKYKKTMMKISHNLKKLLQK